jgi:CO/xanthine dehydrogenase FAD-binding subunit
MLNDFNVIEADTLTDALAVMAKGEVTPIGGGTDLLVKINKGILAPGQILDISKLRELNEIKVEGENIVIGSTVTHSGIVNSKVIGEYAPLLAQGCATVGSPQIRNMATIGGNIINASPSADSIPALIALDTKVIISSIKGKREVLLEDFILGPGKTQILPQELLTAIIIKKMKSNERYMYRKIGQRNSLAISIASVAVRFEFLPGKKKCRNAAIAFGAVAPVIRRIHELEKILEEERLDNSRIKEISEKAKEFCRAISDIRASAKYRKDLCFSLLYEVLQTLTYY